MDLGAWRRGSEGVAGPLISQPVPGGATGVVRVDAAHDWAWSTRRRVRRAREDAGCGVVHVAPCANPVVHVARSSCHRRSRRPIELPPSFTSSYRVTPFVHVVPCTHHVVHVIPCAIHVVHVIRNALPTMFTLSATRHTRSSRRPLRDPRSSRRPQRATHDVRVVPCNNPVVHVVRNAPLPLFTSSALTTPPLFTSSSLATHDVHVARSRYRRCSRRIGAQQSLFTSCFRSLLRCSRRQEGASPVVHVFRRREQRGMRAGAT